MIRLVGLACLAPAFAACAAPRVTYTVTLLCDFSGPQRTVDEETLRLSDDMLRVAAVVKRRGKEHVAMSGPDGTAVFGMGYPAIPRPRDLAACETVRFSPDGARVGYTAKLADGSGYAVVVRDGDGETVSAPFAFIHDGMPLWSPDSRHYAFIALHNGRVHVAVDGGERGTFEDVQADTFRWSPDGRVLAWSGRDGPTWSVYGFTKPLPANRGVAEPGVVFSPDSRRVAYAARRGGGWELRGGDDQKAWRENGYVYDAVSMRSPAWSADSSHVAWAARRHGGWFIVVDGLEVDGPFDAIAEGTPVWSIADSELAYGAQQGGDWLVIAQSHYGRRVHARGSELLARMPRYSASGNFLLYAVRNQYGWRVGQQMKEYAAIKAGTLAVSRDGRTTVFAGAAGDGWAIVVDGHPMSTAGGPLLYDDVGPVRLSADADTSTFAIAAKRLGAWVVVVNGEERHSGYRAIQHETLAVSRDGRRVAWCALDDDGWALWIDGIRQPCGVPYTYRFHPETGLLEGLVRDTRKDAFHAIREVSAGK